MICCSSRCRTFLTTSWTCFGMFISSAEAGRHVLPLTMFWHVYFFRRICQACASLWTCFGMFISSAHLSGMRSSLDMFWHVYFFNCICQVCAALWTCFGMFISPVEPARHVLLLTVFSHLCCQVALTQR